MGTPESYRRSARDPDSRASKRRRENARRGPNGRRGDALSDAEASQTSIVPPAVWHGEASLPVRRWPREGLRQARPYTPAVRRWVCVVALLWGFTRQDYAWSARSRIPIPVERLLDAVRDADLPEEAWWTLT